MTNPVALVTGSSRGIGFQACRKLAMAGFSIAVNAPNSDEEFENAVCSIESLGASVYRAAFDVSDTRVHTSMLEKIELKLGPLTTLVNNAGIGVIERGDPLDVTEESFDRCMQVNARAVFFLSQAFARRLVDRERNATHFQSIINVTSANAQSVAETRAEYSASKAAASMISSAFAVRLGRENISVYDVQPGLINTEMTRSVIDSYSKRAKEGLCLIPRVGQPEEVGEVIANLATGVLPYTTGQVVSVDGGMLVPRF